MDTKDRIAKTQKQAHARYWLIVSLGFFLTMDRSLFIECIQREGSLFVIVQIIIGAVVATTFDFQRNFNFETMESESTLRYYGGIINRLMHLCAV